MSGTDKKKYTVKFISDYIDASVVGDAETQVDNIASIESATFGSITFLSNPKYKKLLDQTEASAVIVQDDIKTSNNITLLVCNDPYLAYAKLSKLFANKIDLSKGSIHDSSFIHESVALGEGVVIGPNVFIGENCSIGDQTIVHPNTTIYKDVLIGKDCIIHPNCVLGSDGFGFASENDKYQKIEQLGGLEIGNNVEIGAGCTIDAMLST